jgi:beta-lactamase regulating signal transducer with metallopeptidase domain
MSFPFFLEMAWKSALIAGATLLLAAFLKSRSAADRAAILRLGIGLLLALPIISLLLPALQVELAAAAAEEMQPAMLGSMLAPEAALPMSSLDVPAMEAGQPTIWDDPSSLIAIAYLGGLLMAALRLGAGLLTLRRWTRASRPVESPEWIAAFDRVREGRGARLLVSAEAPSPLSWGWRSPVILIDRDTLDRPEDALAILEHEMAHVIRRDWPALMLARTAAILFWFNPLVWLLERAFVQHAEEAADCHAVGRVEPAFYAQTLLGCVNHVSRSRSLLPANSIASTGLARRVKAILDGRVRATKSGSMWTLAAMAGCVAFAAPLAALELTEAPPPPPAAPSAPIPPAVPAQVAAVADLPVPPQAPAVPLPPKPMSARDYEALGKLQAEIPVAVASAMGHVAVEVGHPAHETRGVSDAEIERAVKQAQREARHAAAEAQRATKEAMRGLSQGAKGMEEGAKGMEDGARQMRDEARKLRSKSYRDEQIAKAAARGETVTHEDLLEAADGLQEGSEGMIEGAREMREAAAKMRRQPHG